VRAELREKVIAKYWDAIEQLAAHMLPGKPKEKQIWRRVFRTKIGKSVMRTFEASLKPLPDDRFEAVMAELDSKAPVDLMRRAFTTGLGHLPKKRGGRPGMFSLDVRQRAIQDIGHEYPRCDSLADAIELVAGRYGMSTEYLRKVWKNRKRLRRDQKESKE
jgi:hypothetical protein